jgi:hypothetical protein
VALCYNFQTFSKRFLKFIRQQSSIKKPRGRAQGVFPSMVSSKLTLRLIGAFAALAALALAVSCQGFFPPAQIESITIEPTTATVPVGETFQMQAFGVDTTGNQLGSVTNKVDWSSSDPSQISIGENTGLMTGVALSPDASPVTITASYEALSPQTATASVCVQGGTDFALVPNQPGSTIGGDTFTLGQGDGGFHSTIQANGTTSDVTASTTWTSSNTAALTITGGEVPAAVETFQVTQNTPVTVTGTYACGTSSFTASVVITVTVD